MAQAKGCVPSYAMENIETPYDPKKDPNPSKKYSLWPNATVPYMIDTDLHEELQQLIKQAIEEFHEKTPIKWKAYNAQHDANYVCFEPASDPSDAYSQVGCNNCGKQLVKLTYPYIPESRRRWKKVNVMHEMMHVIGFFHEQQRVDSPSHHKAAETRGNDLDFVLVSDCVNVGHYDYQSIMHYPCYYFDGLYLDDDVKQQMEQNVEKLDTFSKMDLAAIKILYGIKDGHYGVWHRACTNKACNDTLCYCGSCGQSQPWCGFHPHKKRNTKGHWTCCFNEDEKSKKCHMNGHHGFWHMECEQRCDAKKHGCKCGACGAGCLHEGKKAHWSCCLVEKFEAPCPTSPFEKKNSKTNAKTKVKTKKTKTKKHEENDQIENSGDEGQ